MAESGQGGITYAVDSMGLAEFLAFLDRELSTTVGPVARAIVNDQSHGLDWGTTLDGRLVEDARTRYAETQAEAAVNVARYHWAAMLMTEVIQRLMQNYRTSEEMAHLRTDDVLALFTQAHRDAIAGSPLAAETAAWLQETWRVLRQALP